MKAEQKLSEQWQQIITNNDESITGLNTLVIYFKNNFDKDKIIHYLHKLILNLNK